MGWPNFLAKSAPAYGAASCTSNTRRNGGADSFVRALAEARALGPRDRTPPAAAHSYDITRSAAQLMDVYAATTRSMTPSTSPQGVPSS